MAPLLLALMSAGSGCRDNTSAGAAEPAEPDTADSELCPARQAPRATCPGDQPAGPAFADEVSRLVDRVAAANGSTATDIRVWLDDESDRRRAFAVAYRVAPVTAASHEQPRHCVALTFAEERGVWSPRVPTCLPGLGPTGGAKIRTGSVRVDE